MKCKYCGQEIDKGSLFCGYCGKQQPQTKKCINCGQEIDINYVFCGYCGTKQNAQDSEHTVSAKNDAPIIHEKEPSESVSMPSAENSELAQEQIRETIENEVSNESIIDDESNASFTQKKTWFIVFIVCFLILLAGAGVYYYSTTSNHSINASDIPSEQENLTGMKVKDAIDKGYIIQVSVDKGATGNGGAFISVKSPSGEVYPTNAKFRYTSTFNDITEDRQETCGFMGFTEEGKKAISELYYSINGDYDWTDAKSSYFSDNTLIGDTLIEESVTSENDEYSDPIDDIQTELDKLIGTPEELQIYVAMEDTRLYKSIMDESGNHIGIEPSNEIIKEGTTAVTSSWSRTSEQIGDYIMFDDGYDQSQPCLASSSIDRYTYQYGFLSLDVLDKAILTFTSTDKSQIKLLKVKTNCHYFDCKEEGYCYVININNKRLGVLSNESDVTYIRCFTDNMKVLSTGTITKDIDFEPDDSNCGAGTYCIYIPEIQALCLQDFQMITKLYYLSEIDIITPTSSTE